MIKYLITPFILMLLTGCSESTETNTDNTNPASSSTTWKLETIVDEFGKETDEKQPVAEFTGTMSNSATTESLLTINAWVGETRSGETQLYFELLEYGDTPAQMPDFEFIEAPIRKSDGEVVRIDMIVNKSRLGPVNSGELLEMLLASENGLTIRLDLVQIDRNSQTVYVFDIDKVGLAALLE